MKHVISKCCHFGILTLVFACSEKSGFGSGFSAFRSKSYSFEETKDETSGKSVDGKKNFAAVDFETAKSISMKDFFESGIANATNEDFVYHGHTFCRPYDFLMQDMSIWQTLIDNYDTVGNYWESYGIFSVNDLDEEKAEKGVALAAAVTCGKIANHVPKSQKGQMKFALLLGGSHGAAVSPLVVTTQPNLNPPPNPQGGDAAGGPGNDQAIAQAMQQAVQADQHFWNNVNDAINDIWGEGGGEGPDEGEL